MNHRLFSVYLGPKMQPIPYATHKCADNVIEGLVIGSMAFSCIVAKELEDPDKEKVCIG